MKRRYGGRIVQRIIVTAMAVMLSANSVIILEAEEALETENLFSEEAEDSEDVDETENIVLEEVAQELTYEATEQLGGETEEENEAEELMQSVSEMAEEATSKAAEAEEAATEAENIVAEATEQLENIQKDMDEEDCQILEKEAEQIEENAAILTQQIEDSLIVTQNPDGTEEYQVIIGYKKADDGEQQAITMQEYVDKQTAIAENAKAELENALQAKAGSDELKEYVEAAQEATKNVYNAAWLAEQAYAKSETQLKEEIKEYNAYAKVYGYDLMQYEGEIPEYTEEEQRTFLEKAGINEELSDVRSDIAELGSTTIQDQLEKIEDARNTVDAAKEAYDTTQQAVTIMEETLALADNAVTQAEERYAKAQEELDEVLEKINSFRPDLNNLQMELIKKINAVNEAKKDLLEVRQQRKNALSYSQWAQELLKSNNGEKTTRVYGQLTEAGSPVISDKNGKGFDTNDGDVISHNVTDFVEVTNGPEGTVIPYEIFRAYVESMYDRKDSNGNLLLCINGVGKHGLGISTGEDSDKESTMPEIYWDYDTETGRIISESMYIRTADGELPEWMTTEGHIYFKGYTFKYEDDGYYHIDGYLCRVSEESTEPEEPMKPEKPTEPVNPSSREDNNSTESVSSNDSENTDTTVITEVVTPLSDSITIEDEVVPLTGDISDEDIVTINEDDVALADAVPATSDATRDVLPLAMAGIGMVVISVFSKLFRKRSN